MCGIVGYIGRENASDVILDGLSRLEYRGYDSAGIAVITQNQTHIQRSEGKLLKLKEALTRQPMPKSPIGIGHTRWATHGRPSEANAHPHHYGPIALVHNGIIENYAELREELQNSGHMFSSQTDSEILAHLVADELKAEKETLAALRKALQKIRGSYAVALLNEKDPEHLYVARFGSPLVIGLGEGENFLASDIPALLPYTQRMVFLEDGEIAGLSAQKIEIQDLSGKTIERKPTMITWSIAMAEKAGFKHFMLKEIFEQPRALTDTLRGRLLSGTGEVDLPELDSLFQTKEDLDRIERIYLVACGTSWHAASICRYFLEKATGVIAQVDLASEFRYRDPLLDARTLVIAISQSGETADTLVALRNAKQKGAKTLSVVNVVGSSIARESHAVVYTHAGPEIGVAATKTFTCQIAALLVITLGLGRKRNKLTKSKAEEVIQALRQVPHQMEQFLKTQANHIREVALKYADADHFLFIGRGPQFPIALEGALKLKEISYMHAEGYAAGELKHGPIALIDRGSPVMALVPKDDYYEKMISNIEEILARQASVIAVASEGDRKIFALGADVIALPSLPMEVMPLLTALPMQLMAYSIADRKGHDVDQPRNLAKSVTVE